MNAIQTEFPGIVRAVVTIGMDVISLGDFHLTYGGNTIFKFVIPPEECPNNGNN